MKIPPKIMNREISLYKIFALVKGQLKAVHWINDTNDYDHFQFELHHYIPYSIYERNKEWFQARGLSRN